jgi:hypothetical protein
VSEEDLASGEDPLPYRVLPIGSLGGQIDLVDDVVDLAHDEVSDAVQHVILVGHVVIKRHRFGPELFGEPTHRE